MLGLHPAQPLRVACAAREKVVGHLLREGQIFRHSRGHAMQIEQELRDAGGSAALADVVPEAGRALFGDAALQDGVRRSVHPGQPLLVASDLGELIPEARRAGRTVAPAQVDRYRVRRAGCAGSGRCPLRSWRWPGGISRRRAQPSRYFFGRSRRSDSSVMKRLRQEIRDAGGAVREVRHHARRVRRHLPLQSAVLGNPELDQTVGDRGGHRTRRIAVIGDFTGIQKEQPDPGVAAR